MAATTDNSTFRWPSTRCCGAGLICLLPLAIWFDYLRSIYQSDVFAGGDHITIALSGLWWKLRVTKNALLASGLTFGNVANIASLLALAGQAAALLWCTRRWFRVGEGSRSWLMVAWMFLMLGLVAHQVVWTGTPGAFTRVTLPLAVGVNAVLAAAPQAPWSLIVAANLGVVSGLMAFGFGWI